MLNYQRVIKLPKLPINPWLHGFFICPGWSQSSQVKGGQCCDAATQTAPAITLSKMYGGGNWGVDPGRSGSIWVEVDEKSWELL